MNLNEIGDIQNEHTIRLSKTLTDIAESAPNRCQLVGSRRVLSNKVQETTDYDFLVDGSGVMNGFLIDLGFIRVVEAPNSPYPFDNWLDAIWIHPNTPDIQVQERDKFIQYLDVIDSIDNDFYEVYLWKSNPFQLGFTVDRHHIMTMFNQLFRTYASAR